MGFDLATAQPVEEKKTGFDLSTAQPIDTDMDVPSQGLQEGTKKGLFTNRLSNIGQEFSSLTENRVPGDEYLSSVTKATHNLPGVLWRSAGQVAGIANDVVGELAKKGITALYNASIPDEAQKAFQQTVTDIINSKSGKDGIVALQSVSEAYNKVKEKFPKQLGNVEAGLNIAGAVPTVAATKYLGKNVIEGGKALKDAATIPKNIASLDKLIDDTVKEGFTKGIKPTIVGKSDANLVEKHLKDATTAVKDIVNTVEEPISKSTNPLEAFSQGSYKTKMSIWDAATKISSGASDAGIMVDIKPVIGRIKSMAADANLARTNPPMVKYLNDLADTWQSKPTSIAPQEAEDLLARLNNSAKGYWRDPNSHTAAALTEDIARATRKQTYDAMESFKGKGYEELRKRYGAQLAIEKEVSDRATIYSRKGEFGFFDLANIPSAAEFVKAVVTADPVSLAKAGGMLLVKGKMKAMNDPSNIVRDMFRKVEKYEEVKKQLSPEVLENLPKVGPYVSSSDIDKQIADETVKNQAMRDSWGGYRGNVRRPYEGAPLPSGTARVAQEQDALRVANLERIQSEIAEAGGGDISPYAKFQDMLLSSEIKPLTAMPKDQQLLEKLREEINKYRLK
jgi:hypothetical protein